MRSAAGRGVGPLGALIPVLGAAVAVVLPAPSGAFTAGLIAALLTILVAVAVGPLVAPVGIRAGSQTRAALERMVPRTAQSDPDARGHARPRAPGGVLPAV